MPSEWALVPQFLGRMFRQPVNGSLQVESVYLLVTTFRLDRSSGQTRQVSSRVGASELDITPLLPEVCRASLTQVELSVVTLLEYLERQQP